MSSESLEVMAREATGSNECRRMRKRGMVPAVLYGHGEECVNLMAKREAIEAVVRHGSVFVELHGAVTSGAVIRELQWDTFGTFPLHIDFVRASKTERVHVKVPLDMKGEAPGHRSGGVVTLVVHELELECTPDAIPDHLHAVINNLELGGTIKVRDLQLPEGARVIADADEVLVTCVKPGEKLESEDSSASEPEVIGRKAAEESEGAE
ncbi:MAG: 50S ribosomal protein L25 [Pirellulales bacterium]